MPRHFPVSIQGSVLVYNCQTCLDVLGQYRNYLTVGGRLRCHESRHLTLTRLNRSTELLCVLLDSLARITLQGLAQNPGGESYLQATTLSNVS